MDTGFIRSLYHPLQPSENNAGDRILLYREQIPCALLQPFIHCFWELNTTPHLSGACSYRVVSDGCIDLVIDCSNYQGMLIAGVSDTAFDVPITDPVTYFGIRFLPTGINHFAKFPLQQVRNQMLLVDDLPLRSLKELPAMIFEQKEFRQRIYSAEKFFLARLEKISADSHPGLATALYHILSGGGDISIQSKAAACISSRQLRRLFHEQVGCSPKTFARIIRFQKTLHSLRYGNPNEQRNAFYGHGYFDQAHFIKDFKILYGDTPRSLTLQPAAG